MIRAATRVISIDTYGNNFDSPDPRKVKLQESFPLKSCISKRDPSYVTTSKPLDQVSIITTVYKLHELLRTAAIVLSTASHDGNKQ